MICKHRDKLTVALAKKQKYTAKRKETKKSVQKPKSRRREIQNVALVGCGKPIGLLKLLALAVLHFLAKKGMHSALLALWQVLYSVLVVAVSVCSLQLSVHIILLLLLL